MVGTLPVCRKQHRERYTGRTQHSGHHVAVVDALLFYQYDEVAGTSASFSKALPLPLILSCIPPERLPVYQYLQFLLHYPFLSPLVASCILAVMVVPSPLQGRWFTVLHPPRNVFCTLLTWPLPFAGAAGLYTVFVFCTTTVTGIAGKRFYLDGFVPLWQSLQNSVLPAGWISCTTAARASPATASEETSRKPSSPKCLRTGWRYLPCSYHRRNHRR